MAVRNTSWLVLLLLAGCASGPEPAEVFVSELAAALAGSYDNMAQARAGEGHVALRLVIAPVRAPLVADHVFYVQEMAADDARRVQAQRLYVLHPADKGERALLVQADFAEISRWRDGHLNRVLKVSLDGEVTEMIAFGNIVPTGLEIHGNRVYMAEAGPNPHLPQDGKVVTFGPKSGPVTEIASGAPLLVDVEFGPGRSLYALSQGEFEAGLPDGAPAMPNTGSLVEINRDGTFTVIMAGLNQPTSLEFIGNTAYVVSLAGEIYKIDSVSPPPYGTSNH